jgi:hypothetical protein
MALAQKPDFVFRQNGRVHLNRAGMSVQSTTGSRSVRTSGGNAGYTMFRGSVKGTGYPLHSTGSPSLPLPVRYHVPLHFNLSLPLLAVPRIFVEFLHFNIFRNSVKQISNFIKI